MSLKEVFTPGELEELQKNALPIACPHVQEDDFIRRGFILFGAGAHGRMVLECLLHKKHRPDWIVDNNTELHGTMLHDIPVRPAATLRDAGERYVLLAGMHAPSMLKDCQAHDATNWILPAAISDFVYTAGECGVSLAELDAIPEVGECYRHLSDEQSREIFKDFIRFQCSFDMRLARHHAPDIYFPHGIKDMVDYSCFMDVGAYDGDTLKSWLQHADSGTYHGFEPQKSAYRKLTEAVDHASSNKNVTLHAHNVAVGSKACKMHLNLDDVSATLSLQTDCSSSSSADLTEVVRMDAFCGKNIRPTVIKADVEGFESEVLAASKGIIYENTTLMMSLYHKKYDFFLLPLAMKKLQKRSRLFLRHHTPGYGDTVGYAVP